MPNPIDWDNFEKVAASTAKAEAEKTNQSLSDELTRRTRLTDAEVAQLAPTLADKEQLARLMKIVNSATEHNKKIAAIVKNAEQFGSIILKLGELVAKA